MATPRILALVVLHGLLQACTLITPPPPRADCRDVIVDVALAQIDRPYRHQGAGPAGFDASGLVQYVYERCAIELPHSVETQRGLGMIIPLREARRGDLLFYRLEEARHPGLHVGIHIGRARMVHVRVNGQVQIERIDVPYWQRRQIDAASYLP